MKEHYLFNHDVYHKDLENLIHDNTNTTVYINKQVGGGLGRTSTFIPIGSLHPGNTHSNALRQKTISSKSGEEFIPPKTTEKHRKREYIPTKPKSSNTKKKKKLKKEKDLIRTKLDIFS